LIKLDAKYYYNVTRYESFINKVYDLVGQPSCLCKWFYLFTYLYRTLAQCYIVHSTFSTLLGQSVTQVN